MGQLQTGLGGALFIGAVVVAGAWYAAHSDRDSSPQAYWNGAATSGQTEAATVSGSLNWTADGNLLLLTYGPGADLGVTLYDAQRDASRAVADVGPLSAACLSADGRHVLAATYRGALWWIDVNSPDSPTNVLQLPQSEFARTIALAGDGEWIAAGSTAGQIYVCDRERAFAVKQRMNSGSAVVDVRFSKSALHLVSAHDDGVVRVWEVATGKGLVEFRGHDRGAFAAAFLSDGERILSAGGDDTVRMWDFRSGGELWRCKSESLGRRSLAVSADGSLAAWGGHSHSTVVWDIDRGEPRLEIFTTASCVSPLSFSPDGSLLAAVETDTEKSVRVYDLQRGTVVRRISMGGASFP
jgi:WD40 repeat protein